MSTAAAPRFHVRDLTHPVVAGIVSVIVNYGGTFILVFQAAKVAGLSPEMTASWVWSVSIGVGVTGVLLSWFSREPIITAWSTPAAAFLVTALATTSYAEAVGAYLMSAAAFVVLGLTGGFEKLIRWIPPGIAAGLLAGILLQFGIGAFGGLSLDPWLAGLLIGTYLMLKRLTARYAIVGVLLLGLAYLLAQGRVDLGGLELRLASPVFTRPIFSVHALLSLALPLFLITLTGQYMPGMLVLRNDGFRTSANPMGVLYILVGVFGVTLAAVFMALPATFIATLAGLALLGTIGGSLAAAMADAKTREASLITFLAAAANVQMLGIGGAFWGLLIGLAAYAALHTETPR